MSKQENCEPTLFLVLFPQSVPPRAGFVFATASNGLVPRFKQTSPVVFEKKPTQTVKSIRLFTWELQ